MTKSRGINSARFVWREEVEVAMLREHYATVPGTTLAAVFGIPVHKVHTKAKRMGLKRDPASIGQVQAQIMANHGHPGRSTQFQPGTVPPNKGLKRPGFAPGDMGKTQFKPGSRPVTWVPIGSYRVVEGTLERKFADVPGPPHHRWRSAHRLVWEAANGPTPAGHVVAFKPGRKTLNPDEITLDAVECISRKDLAARNTIHQLPPELAALCRLRGQLTRAINRKQKESEPHE